MALHVAGHGIRPAGFARTLRENRRQAAQVVGDQGVVDMLAQGIEQGSGLRVRIGIAAIIGRHAGAAVAHQIRFLEPGQVRGHARLRQAQYSGKLGHGEFLAFQQREQTHPGRVGEQAQQNRCRGQVQQVSFHLDRKIDGYGRRPHTVGQCCS